MDEFESQRFVDLVGVVPVALQVSCNDFLQPLSFNIRPAKTARIKQHFPDISRERIPVPEPEMKDLVPS